MFQMNDKRETGYGFATYRQVPTYELVVFSKVQLATGSNGSTSRMEGDRSRSPTAGQDLRRSQTSAYTEDGKSIILPNTTEI